MVILPDTGNSAPGGPTTATGVPAPVAFQPLPRLRLEGAPISGLSDAWVPATDGPPPAADDSCPTAPPTPSGLRSPRVPVLVKDGPAFCT
ncbi:unnamed protein product [Lampetra fluviatilis]